MAENGDAGRKRPLAEIAAELKGLQETSGDRNQLSLLHEVSVYQEELVAQNEALTLAQTALEETRDRYIELYEFAPNAYVTLDRQGLIRGCNLTAAALFGKSPRALEGLPLANFVVQDRRQSYFHFLRRCRAGVYPVEASLRIRTAESILDVELLCRPRQSSHSADEFLTSIVDVTQRYELERERARIAAEHAGLAVRLLAAQDEERQRIARNLHDDLGQQVTAVRLALDALTQHAGGGELRAALARLRGMVEHLDERLHFVATELRPAALDLGLVTTLQQFVREWSSTFGVQGAFHASGVEDGLLSPDVEVHLYRIAQEALNNVAKHARARHASVLLEARGEGVVLVIEDDGQGFDMAQDREAPSLSLGLVSMRERAQVAGGRFDVESVAGQGTSIYVHVPVRR